MNREYILRRKMIKKNRSDRRTSYKDDKNLREKEDLVRGILRNAKTTRLGDFRRGVILA